MRLSNEYMSIEVSSKGAELQSIFYNDKEYLWQGDETFWGRKSPILFPNVGKLLDDEYVYEGKTYHLTQHGFARDRDFTLVEVKEDSLLYLLTENQESLRNYPFEFSLYIRYKLVRNRLDVSWKVVNANTYPMYFSIGAHPAFNFGNGSVIEINQTTNIYDLNQTPYVHNVISNKDITKIVTDNKSFIRDAIIYDNIDKVSLYDEYKRVELDCTGFPFLGIWSKVINGRNAPFICLEPWYGIADYATHNKEFVTKKGVMVLEPNSVFNTKYSITVL